MRAVHGWEEHHVLDLLLSSIELGATSASSACPNGKEGERCGDEF